jgi:hypothetical protein
MSKVELCMVAAAQRLCFRVLGQRLTQKYAQHRFCRQSLSVTSMSSVLGVSSHPLLQPLGLIAISGRALSECIVQIVSLSALRSQAMAWQRLKVDVTADSCSRPGRQSQVLHLGDLGVDHTDG